MDPITLISKVRSGVAQIVLDRQHQRIASGSAFLVKEGLVTNSHVLRDVNCEAVVIRFHDSRPSEGIRLSREDCLKSAIVESPVTDKDFVYVPLWEPEFEGRHVFELTGSEALSIGEQVVFLGFPFDMDHLTAHVGYVASLHKEGGTDVIQIDGSVNGGNSGGPLMDLKTGKVAGIVTRAQTGLIEDQFEALINALRQNQQVLRSKGGVVGIGGVDPIAAISASQAAMEQIALNLKRSANVGIGYAFSAHHLKEHIDSL